MRETHLCTALRREILFIAACAAAAVLCVGLAVAGLVFFKKKKWF